MPKAFEGAPKSYVSHSSDHSDLTCFRGQQVLVIGGGQSALDAARIMHLDGIGVELIAKQAELNWVGEHYWLHKLGVISSCLYSKFDVGPAGISRLVGVPKFLPEIAAQLAATNKPPNASSCRYRLATQAPDSCVTMTLDCHVTTYRLVGDKIQLTLSNGTERLVDHVIVATGYRVDCARYKFLSPSIQKSPEDGCRSSYSGPRVRILGSRDAFRWQARCMELWSSSELHFRRPFCELGADACLLLSRTVL